MITQLTDMPAGVIGFEVDGGKLEASDYTDILVPTIEKAAEAGPVRAVIVLNDFDGMSGGAMKEDLKLATHHLTALTRTAVVTDIEWVKHFMSLFGWMVHGKIRAFPLSDRAAAITWAAADD